LKALGAGAPAVVSVVAALVAVLGWCVPRTWAACATVGRSTAAASVCAGVLLCIPGVYDLAIRVMGTDAIAWRLTWVVPVPILVGLLAGLPRWSQVRAGALVGGLAAVALVWGGLPVWSASNAAWGARPPAWKVYPADLGAARWVAAQQNSGRVLAPAGVVAALGVVTADARPVGSRVDYMVNYSDLPGTRMPQRLLLQRLAEGGSDAADVAAAPAALSALRVWVACTLPGDVLAHEVLQPQGYVLRFREGPLACWSGGRAFSDGTGGR
jgi:hypothetical protein